MQVNLLPLHDAALVCSRMAGLPLFVPGASPEPSKQAETEELRERVRRDEEAEARAAATLVPTRSADVISDAERNVERSSRAFRRQLARDGAAEQFRQGRQAFREALTDAKEKGARVASQSSADADRQSAAKTQPKANADSHVAAGRRASPAAGTDSASAPMTRDAARPIGSQVADPGAASVRALPSAGTAAAAGTATAAALDVAVSGTMAARPAQSRPGAGPVALSTLVRAAKPGGTVGAKAGSAALDAAASTRRLAKPGTLTAAKGGTARPAENAAWRANIERIVRVVRSRISAERSHTVLRLAPPELGSLRLQLDLRGEALTLRVDTSTDLAHRLLSEDLDKLRHGLEASGIQLERIEVRPPPQTPDASEHNMWQQPGRQDEAQGQSAQTDAEHPQERGTDSHPAASSEGTTRGTEPEPATESLVNVVA
jgi:flagellar hook-length control protein FliK